MRGVRIISLLFLLATCHSRPDKLQVAPNNQGVFDQPKLVYDTAVVAIIRLDSSKHVIGDRASAPAIISQHELVIVDSIITAYVARYNADLKGEEELYRINMAERNYRMQLVAFINPEGEKEVWVNAFCQVSGDHWKSSPVVVFDGGACYFQININLTKKRFYNSIVNGVA